MNRILVAAAVLAAGLVSAQAADLGRPAYKAAPVAAPAYNWSGFYAGIVGGYGKLDTGGELDVDGGFVGGTLGWNWQAPGSAFVGGVEVDMSWADISGSASDTVAGLTATLSSDLDWFGTARLRGGFTTGPALFYVTGGVAWAHNEISIAIAGLGVAGTATSDATHVGWTVGGGVEWVVSGPWTAKVEYLYVDLDSENYFTSLVPGGLSADGKMHLIRGGLNYRFGG